MTEPASTAAVAPPSRAAALRGYGATALLLATVGGLVAGGVDGVHYLVAGFPRLIAPELATGTRHGLGVAFAFALIYALVRPLAGRLLRRPSLAVALATVVAGLPFLLAAGYLYNRARAFLPGDLLTLHGLLPNLGVAAAVAAVAALAGWLLERARRGRGPGRGAVVAALVALVAVEGGRAAPLAGAPAEAPPVCVLLDDALRADELGCYGGPRPTPAIDALAKDGVRFSDAVAASTFTKTSIASLFTSRHPYQHAVYRGGREGTRIVSDILGAGETTLAEVLRSRGYLTTAWIQNTQLLGFMGFAQGFVDYHAQLGHVERIHARLLPWLAGPGRVVPLFAYVHYIDLHDPYDPLPEDLAAIEGKPAGADPYAGIDRRNWGSYLEEVRSGKRAVDAATVRRFHDAYAAQLRRVDREIGRLVAALRRDGLYERSLIVVLSDHGDAFLEHGFLSHSATPYEELTHVPLIVKLPGNGHAGTVVDAQVRHVDVMPTILDAVGITPPPTVMGCSLLPLLRAGGVERRDPSCAVALTEIAEQPGEPTIAVRTGRWKLIRRPGGRDELYDLEHDRGERHDLAAAHPPELAPLARLAEDVASRRGRSAKVDLDPEVVRQLKALGYVE